MVTSRAWHQQEGTQIGLYLFDAFAAVTYVVGIPAPLLSLIESLAA
jgi:hypothetical protein